jgi:hypothetical protein
MERKRRRSPKHGTPMDYSGGPEYLGYCPLGQGKVDIPAILAMMDGRKTAGLVMVELDSPPPQPAPARKRADREGLSGKGGRLVPRVSLARSATC